MKIKEFLKKNLIGFILGIVSAWAIIVYAATYFPSNDVTYDNKESGLASTNVQGAIDELYVECTTVPTGEQIIEDNNLEKDQYECRYFFTGANPNNYVTFNNETAGWRIISVECDGTIKIMRNESIGNKAYNNTENSDWNVASLNTYLNGTYYNELNEIAQNQITDHDFSIGAVTYNDTDLGNTVNNENSKKWNGKIALPTISESIRSNSNKNSCGSMDQLWNNTGTSCEKTSWMSYSIYWWTLSPDIDSSYHAYLMHPYGGISNGGRVTVSYAVRPSLYLSSDIKITGGNGSQSNPYQISM